MGVTTLRRYKERVKNTLEDITPKKEEVKESKKKSRKKA